MNLNGNIDPRKAEITAQRTPDKSEIVVVMKLRNGLTDKCIGCDRLMHVSLYGRQVISKVANDEYLFIIDNSKFLDRRKWCNEIRKALLTALSAIPPGSFVNVCVSGAGYFVCNDTCAQINRELVRKVENLPRLMDVDPPGDSSLHGALTRFFSQPLVGKCRSRQIFVLTPGQLRDVTQTLDLCQDCSAWNRIFTFALGNRPNHGLVEGMAELTGGHCVYVEERDRDNLTELLMRELRTSLTCSICDVTIDVDGRDDIELSRFPNPPVVING